jgi:hypothetical protein
MAKAILKFDLSDPDDRLDHMKAVKANDAFLALWNISDKYRSLLKHGDLSDDKYEVVENLYKEFFEEMESQGINLDELIR